MGRMFEGKVALVTAGANGIGRATALAFAREGAAVMVSDIDEAGGRSVVDIIRGDGAAEFILADATSEAAVKALIDGTVERFGGFDYALNNVGHQQGSAAFGDLTLEDWNYTVGISLTATWLCLRAQLPVMVSRGGGAIVNTSSTAGIRTTAGANAAYSAAKAGVISLTEYAAVHYAKQGVRVNCIAPGLVRSAGVERLFSKEVQNEIASGIHLIPRIIEPDEIAAGVIYLCSDHAAMVTGVTLPIAGGYNAS